VKNKHLVIAAVAVLAAVGLVRAAGDTYLFTAAEAARRNNDLAKALAYYNRFLQEYPGDERVPEALYWSALMLPSRGSLKAVIFPGLMSITHRPTVVDDVSADMGRTKEERLRRVFTDYPDHWAAPHALNRYAMELCATGHPEAEEYLLRAVHDHRISDRIRTAFALADLYLAQGRAVDALELMEYCEAEMPSFLPEEQRLKKGDILASMGDLTAARATYQEVMEVFERRVSTLPSLPHRPDSAALEPTRAHYHEQVAERIAALDAQIAAQADHGTAPGHALGTGTIEGVVLLKGQPLAGAQIIAERVTDPARFSVDHSDASRVTTGADGSFRFELPAGGRYQVGIGLSAKLAPSVEGLHLQMIGANLVLNPGETARVELRFVEPVKVTELRPGFVAWEPYHGASAYEVQIDCVSTEESGYSTIGAVMLRTDGHSLEFDEAPVIPFGVIAMDQHGVLPSHLTGMPDAYLIRVQAIDAQGKTISSSPGLRFEPGIDLSSLIRPDRVEPAEAESLLAERKYDEAVAALEDRLAQSPDDLRTLEILARVYFMGTYDCDPDPLSEDMAHRNLARSLSLLERLTELAPTPDNINALDIVRRALERESEKHEAGP